MKPYNLILNCVEGSFALSADGPRKLYRKELAYPGHFVKMGADDRPEFELPVDEGLIDHWVDTFNEMKQDGVDVPVPIGHTTDPGKRRGTIEKMAKEPNDKGEPALFCYVDFSNPQYAEKYKDSNVSLFMPPKWTNGKGKTYRRPITHVAITDYPVIPDLGKFSSVAASFELSLAQDDDMDWNVVAQKLGVKVPEGEDAEECVMNAWKVGEGGGDGSGDGEGMGDDDVLDDEEAGMDDDTFDVDESAHDDLGTGRSRSPDGTRQGQDADDARRRAAMAGAGADSYDPPPSLGFGMSMPPSVVKMAAKGRVDTLKQLARDFKINKVQYDALAKKYCRPDVVGIALSMEQDDPTVSDGFDAMVAVCSMATPFTRTGEQTAAQDLRNAERSPVVVDAERRAEAARTRR